MTDVVLSIKYNIYMHKELSDLVILPPRYYVQD